MKTVMIFGTFDLLHEGHKHFIQEARAAGEYLIVVIGRDQTVLRLKKHLPEHNERERKKNVVALKIADKVVLGSKTNHLAIVKKYKPELILLGYDQTHFADKLAEDLVRIGLKRTQIRRAAAYQPDVYKTSLIKLGRKSP